MTVNNISISQPRSFVPLIHHECDAPAVRRPRWNVEGALTTEKWLSQITHRTIAEVEQAKLDLLAERMALALVLEVSDVHHPASVGRGVGEPVGVNVTS